MTTKNLIKLEDVIKPILEENPDARDDDFYLYSEVIGTLCPHLEDTPLYSALRCHKELGLPNYESVSRVRRKIQEKCPHLASEKVKERRLKEQKEYIEYSKIS